MRRLIIIILIILFSYMIGKSLAGVFDYQDQTNKRIEEILNRGE